jgi:hypothetical protein
MLFTLVRACEKIQKRKREQWQLWLQNYLVSWMEHTALYDVLPQQKFASAQEA